MTMSQSVRILLMAGVVWMSTGSMAHAADAKVEIGGALVSATFRFGDEFERLSSFGIPSSGFGFFQPAVYAAVFLGPRVAIEPRVAFVWSRVSGRSSHALNLSGQLDYFIAGTSKASPYVFGAAGLVDVSGSRSTMQTVSGGVGYRVPLGDRLTMRIDGRMTHISDDQGNSVDISLSLGGLFGRR